ncbi:hypothetical protein [Flavisphingomonas formosensis]|uniref:hypothetical protein n=1 Tax=Flavisphingomonas formosensis TaxID=861534 RepID=UPI0012F848A8|nr:hypothetical protein [Sphingomonas formosensis]
MRRFSSCLAGLQLLLAAPALAETPSDIAGGYFTSQPEVASELMLKPDGRFQWYLSYGALDENATGSWKRQGDTVLLTTEPVVTPPRFSLDAAVPDPEKALKIRVAGPDGKPIGRVDVALTAADGTVQATATDENGYALFAKPGTRSQSVKLGIRVFGVASEAFPVDLAKGNLMLFRFEPNDLGRADFKAEPVRIRDGALVLDRWGIALTYHPADAE